MILSFFLAGDVSRVSERHRMSPSTELLQTTVLAIPTSPTDSSCLHATPWADTNGPLSPALPIGLHSLHSAQTTGHGSSPLCAWPEGTLGMQPFTQQNHVCKTLGKFTG